MQTGFLQTLSFALTITTPIFLLVVLGIGLRRLRLIDNRFINSASTLVFNVGLPTLLFINIAQTDTTELINPMLVMAGMLATGGIFLLLTVSAPWLVPTFRERGIYIQGSFRGNMGIVGLAFCYNAYGEAGEAGIATASIYMAVLTILYNVLSVFILTKTLSQSDSTPLLKTVAKNILKNPIVISIVLALGFSATGWRLHPIPLQSASYISDLTLPLALLCIGGSISLKELRKSSSTSVITVAMKLLIVPLLTVLIVWPFNVSQMDMGIVFLMAAAPTATASYIMVEAMKGNGVLAANIVVITTLGSVVSVSAGIVCLRALGWM